MVTQLLQQGSLSYLTLYCEDAPGILLPLDSLAEVLPLTSVVPIPGMPDPIIGVCPWRGEVVWLVDINFLLGRDPLYQKPQSSYSAVILDFEDQPLGLVAHQIGQIQKIDHQHIDQTSAAHHPLVLGSWQGSDVLDPDQLSAYFTDLSIP